MDFEKDPNVYDFEIEDNDEMEIEPIDDIDNWGADNDPVLNACLEVLAEAKEKWDNVNKLRVPNPTKLIEFMKSYKLLVEIVRSQDKDAKIKCKLDDCFNTGEPVVTITTYLFTIEDIERFKVLLDNIKYVQVSPKTSGGLNVYFGFHNIYDTYLEQDSCD